MILGIMADYYELINKAVASLDPDAPSERRRALYDRAQAALLAKLRSITPPFTEVEITRERVALEDAIHLVEAEILQRVRDDEATTFQDHITAFNDLAEKADELGEPAAEAKRRHYALQAETLEIGRMANPSSLQVDLSSLIVTGNTTGILSRVWRWRSRPKT